MNTLRAIAAAVSAAALFGLAVPAASAQTLAQPALSQQASPSGYPVGSSIYDSAMLGHGNAPTGTINFSLYGPSDPACAGSPLFTASTGVSGNGYYASPWFPVQVAGTYRWRAQYGGDARNAPTAPTDCDDPAGEVIVIKKKPNLNGDASALSAGGTITDTATLAMGGGPAGPTGTITFSLWGPDNMMCAGAPVFTSRVAVRGNGQYTSAPYTPAASGTYQWVVNYSGDANNNARTTICSDDANHVNVSASGGSGGVVGARTTVSGSPTPVARAGALTATWSGIGTPTANDWVALFAIGAEDSAVVAWRYTTGGASGSVTMAVPWGTAPGTYEVRLYADQSLQRLATSSPVTVF